MHILKRCLAGFTAFALIQGAIILMGSNTSGGPFKTPFANGLAMAAGIDGAVIFSVLVVTLIIVAAND